MSKFEITGDLPKIKKFLDEFIVMVEEEFDRQKPNLPLMPMVYKLVYVDEGDKIILRDNFKIPKGLGLFFRDAVKKMEKNIECFLKSRGVKVDCVKYVGD